MTKTGNMQIRGEKRRLTVMYILQAGYQDPWDGFAVKSDNSKLCRWVEKGKSQPLAEMLTVLFCVRIADMAAKCGASMPCAVVNTEEAGLS